MKEVTEVVNSMSSLEASWRVAFIRVDTLGAGIAVEGDHRNNDDGIVLAWSSSSSEERDNSTTDCGGTTLAVWSM